MLQNIFNYNEVCNNCINSFLSSKFNAKVNDQNHQFKDINCVTLPYVAHSSLYVAHSSLYVAHSSLHVAHSSLYVAHSSLYVAHSSLYVAHSSLFFKIIPINIFERINPHCNITFRRFKQLIFFEWCDSLGPWS